MWTAAAVAILLLLTALAVACGDDSGPSGGSGGSPTPTEAGKFGLTSKAIADGDNISALAFAPDGRLFFAEQYTGDIKIVDANGKLLDEPFAHVDAANWLDLDWGLTGLAVDPEFSTNHYVYALYTAVTPSPSDRPIGKPTLVRFTESNDKAGTPETLISFPETVPDHQGFKTNGALHFGPDGFLYISMGDYDTNKTPPGGGTAWAQDLSRPQGKILRVDRDGKAAPGNPFATQAGAGPSVYAYGFNRGVPFTISPGSGDVFATDSTDSCEELDLVKPGGNYGWPDVGVFPFSDCKFGTQVPGIAFLAKPGMIPGQFLSFVNVSGLAFVSKANYPVLGDGLLVCEKETRQMRRLTLAGAALDQVTDDSLAINDCSGDVATAPDGTVVFSNETGVFKLNTQPGATVAIGSAATAAGTATATP